MKSMMFVMASLLVAAPAMAKVSNTAKRPVASVASDDPNMGEKPVVCKNLQAGNLATMKSTVVADAANVKQAKGVSGRQE